MTYKTTTNLKEFDLTGMTLESVKELSEFWGLNYLYWIPDGGWYEFDLLSVLIIDNKVTKCIWA